MHRKATAGLALALLLVSGIAGAGHTLAQQPQGSDVEVPLRLALNVPAHRLFVYENGELTRVYRVSVGMAGHQTPPGSYAIRSVIWNPWWHPPKSQWARDRKPEAPGPANPMGRVKLNFAPLLYLHGTLERDALGDPTSHGCVRLINEDLIELTRLVHRHLTPDLPAETLAELEATPSLTRTFQLPQSVPFEVVYSVAAIRGEFLLLYPDVYKRGSDYRKKVVEALAGGGIDPAKVNWSKLDPLIEHARRAKVAIALDEVVLVSVAPVAGLESR